VLSIPAARRDPGRPVSAEEAPHRRMNSSGICRSAPASRGGELAIAWANSRMWPRVMPLEDVLSTPGDQLAIAER